MYPIVLWQSGRSQHGIIAIREILKQQAMNDAAHAIHAALLYQMQQFELAHIAMVKALTLSQPSNQCILSRLMEILLIMHFKKNGNYLNMALNKIESLIAYINEVHCDYFNEFGNCMNSLVRDSAIIDGYLCFDHLIYAMYVKIIFAIKERRECEPQSKNRKRLKIRQQYKMNENKEMEDVCKKMLHLKPHSIVLKYAIGQLFVYLNKYEDGGSLYRENMIKWNVQCVHPTLSSTQIRSDLMLSAPKIVKQSCISYGLFLSKYKKDYKSAINCFNSLVADKEFDIFQYLGFSLYQIGKFAEARKYYDLSIEREPNRISNYLQMATLLTNEAKYNDAFKYFEAAKDISSDCIAIYLLWSSCLLLNRQYDFAEYRINECLKLCQQRTTNNKQMSMDALYLSAMIKLERGQLKAAESSFKSLIKMYPEFSDAHCFYASCLADLSKKEVAEKHWEDAINLNQHNLSAHYFYALFLFFNGEINKALFHLKECLRINDKHCNSRYILASI